MIKKLQATDAQQGGEILDLRTKLTDEMEAKMALII